MSSENPDVAGADCPRPPEEASGVSAPDAARRSSSIARRVAWSFWWRRLVRWVLVDLLALLAVLAALWVGYARYLPEGALTYHGLVPTEGTSLALAWGFGPDLSGLGSLALRVVPAAGG